MIKFAVMTDLHTDIIHDAPKRVQAFVEAANAESCDFAIQLGDFMQPEFIGSYQCSESRVSPVMKNILAGLGMSAEEKREIWSIFHGLNCPLYHVIGNHDLDLYSKNEIIDYWKMIGPYYSFDINDYHFIVLDANFGLENNETIAFCRGNYMKWMFAKDEPFPYIPKEELLWLENDLASTDKKSIIFSHEGINSGFLNAINYKEIFDILKAAPNGVALCICGHKHQDLLEYEDNIPVYCLNSMSGYAVPAQFAVRRFSEEIENSYPNVQYMCPYENPLYIIVTIDEATIRITGRNSRFIAPGPIESGVHFEEGDVVFASKASGASIMMHN